MRMNKLQNQATLPSKHLKSLLIKNKIKFTVAILGLITSLSTFPILAQDIHNPIANAISLGANHCKIIENCVVLMLSPPNPNIVLPINIIVIDLLEQPIAKINCPIKIEAPKARNINLYPYLNISTPPNKGRTIFGNE
jgi:hypothetical protein